jgi:hypothetical protein
MRIARQDDLPLNQVSRHRFPDHRTKFRRGEACLAQVAGETTSSGNAEKAEFAPSAPATPSGNRTPAVKSLQSNEIQIHSAKFVHETVDSDDPADAVREQVSG